MAKDKNLIKVIEAAVRGGVDGIILREKDLSYEELLPLAIEIKKLTEGTETLLMINGNLQAARKVQADGYHTGFREFIDRKPVFDGMLGVSIHSLEEAVLAEKQGATYLLAGHVFDTQCKEGLAGRGIPFIKDIKEQVEIPVIALGGITPEKAVEVLKAGANGIAVMSSIMMADDPYGLTRRLKNI